jgi:hypothetical protein
MTSHDLGVSNVTFVAPPGLVPDIRQTVEAAYDLPGVSLGQWEFDALGQVGMFVEKLPGGQARLWGGLIEQHGDHAGEFTTPDPRQLDCGLIGSEPVQLGNSWRGRAFIAVDSSNQFVITTIDTLEIAHSHVTVYSGSRWIRTTPTSARSVKAWVCSGTRLRRVSGRRTSTTVPMEAFSCASWTSRRRRWRTTRCSRTNRRRPTGPTHDRGARAGDAARAGRHPGRNLIYTGMYLSSGDKAPLQIVEIDVTCAALPTQTVIVSNSLHKPFGNPFMYRGKRHYICAGHARNDLTYNELHIYREPSAGQYWDRVQEILRGLALGAAIPRAGQLHSPEPTVIPDADGNIVVAFNVQDRSTALSSLEFSGFGALANRCGGQTRLGVRRPRPGAVAAHRRAPRSS